MALDNLITKKIKKQVNKTPILDIDKKCKAIFQGEDFVDCTYMVATPKCGVRRIDKTRYVVLSTGEIKEYEIKDKDFHRQQENLQRTFNNLRWLIRNNFQSNADNQLFITLTYREKMKDGNKLMNDFELFIKRLRREKKEDKLDYIVVAEPTEIGTWHMHLMLKSDKPILILDNNKTIERLWKQGFTTTKRLKSDDVGTYYVAYFTDLIPEALDNEKTDDKTKSNARKKGARLKYYPANFKFYRRSKGIINCKIEETTIREQQEKLGQPVFCCEYTIEQEETTTYDGQHLGTRTLNVITKANFKRHEKRE
jgi:hypothetical protein